MTASTLSDKERKREQIRLKEKKQQDKRIADLERIVTKLLRQTNAHTKTIRSLKANVVRLEHQLRQVDTKATTALQILKTTP